MIIGAIIIGIFILALITLGLYISKRCNDNFDVGVFLGMMLGLLILVETTLVADIIHGPRPSAIDVYRGNTDLEITSVNGTPIDTVVVFKKD